MRDLRTWQLRIDWRLGADQRLERAALLGNRLGQHHGFAPCAQHVIFDANATEARRGELRADGEFTERLARLQAEDAGVSEAQAASAAEGRLLTGGRLFPLRCC